MDATLVAMGGNSLIDPLLPPTVENQFLITARAVAPIAELLGRGERLILTHGNGPQVGFMQLRAHLARDEVHEVPLDSLVADTQGALGYMIQRDLREQLRLRGERAPVATIVTEVQVSRDDPRLKSPDKPVGKFYTEVEAAEMRSSRGWHMVEDRHRGGYRRVVPSPLPESIVQLDTIRMLIANGVTVIACGGGGVPVVTQDDGSVVGLEAVIDKDRTSALQALALGLKRMVITTGVDAVYVHYGREDERKLTNSSVAELRPLLAAGEFPAGSMGPKIEAALEFLEGGGDEVLICHPEALLEAWAGRAGTRIKN